ncbi:hypothetical protein GCM10007874_49350 [Labrys miyagiensis]|uniref:Uncharacterized protein n=1 Tax=Labrys miyagiensis TaxID=346912 RepID=A0ABQ6CNI9_9HYPH|nr:hypothetical protein [Labrys miyagiensis]GLS21918.1 hypothetical protein GCM10007874_49350 [Labrys miyagiensis]
MILEFRLPKISPHMSGATVEFLHSQAAALKAGAKVLDISVDLGGAFTQDCPPVSYYRFVMREPAFLREIKATPGQLYAVDELLAIFSTEPEESLDQSPARGVRVTVAGIMHYPGMWSSGT